MEADILLNFLGQSPIKSDLDAYLKVNRVFDRPHYPEVNGDDEDEDREPVFENARLSLIDEVERNSIALFYEERFNYEHLFSDGSDAGDFVLKEIAFFAPKFRHYRGYDGALPHGLLFSDSIDIVRSKLGAPNAYRQIYTLPSDRFLSKDWSIDVSYVNGGTSIGVVSVRRPHKFDLRMIGCAEVDHDRRAVDLTQLISHLGCSAYDESLEALLSPMGWKSSDFEMADCDEVPNLIKRHGVALYYRDSNRYSMLSGRHYKGDGAVFSGFRVNRSGDLLSRGYDGVLPFGIEFHHSPDEVKSIIGVPPDWISIGDDIGAYKWKLPQHTLHIMFSLIDYQVYRVACFAKFMEDELFQRS